MMGLSGCVAVLRHVTIPVGCQLVVTPAPDRMLGQHSMVCLSLQPVLPDTLRRQGATLTSQESTKSLLSPVLCPYVQTGSKHISLTCSLHVLT